APGTPEDAPRRRLEGYLKSDRPVYILASQRAVEGLEIQFPGLRTLFHRTGIEGWLGADGRWVVLSNRKVEGKPQGAAGAGESGESTPPEPSAESATGGTAGG